jgi:hypothetical protein
MICCCYAGCIQGPEGLVGFEGVHVERDILRIIVALVVNLLGCCALEAMMREMCDSLRFPPCHR